MVTPGSRPTPPETVVCFDRDWTVSVNPHPERESVPLSWVKHFAHERPDVDVWAAGNQRLRAEAAIPGVDAAKRMRADLRTPETDDAIVDPVTGQDVSQPETSPSRRDRLRLVRALYADLTDAVDQFLVVDDVGLTDMEPEGWTHYHSWEFVPAAAGETPVAAPDSTPFTDTPAPRATEERDIHPSAFDPREPG
jgi:hypothetical protein